MNKIFKFRFLGILMFLAMIAVFSVAAMFLWNALMPEIFGLPVLSYWQALGLVVLARILFGGLGPGHFGALGARVGFHQGNPFREKWMNMSEEERVEFVRNHRGFRSHPFFEDAQGKKDVPGEGGKHE
jgi:ABC-type multidrug transport system fused ATPase/permease subunit